MEIKRNKYLNELIRRKENGLINVVTGIRRSGKSYLLFNDCRSEESWDFNPGRNRRVFRHTG